ncbi:hypothetical protein AB0I60_08025 [Actinosynnema sp. NPDC050436]|uniref:hypothetical protein n=1 Tax=Actinosynnema sp. NPDC050436 TaxID=3155659 RepID=UPI0033D01AF2
MAWQDLPERHVSADPGIVRAHRHAAVPAARPFPRGAVGSHDGRGGSGDHAIGRSEEVSPRRPVRFAPGQGRPLWVVPTGGGVDDCAAVTRSRPGSGREAGSGRPAARPSRVVADQGRATRCDKTATSYRA